MQCPKCSSMMTKATTQAGQADRCSRCGGIWLDAMEHETLKEYAKEIDTGDAATGEKYNKIEKIKCPICPNSPMIRMVDNDQPHIWFESCSSCHGRFFDAGEFKDLSENSLSDFMKRFSAQPRP